MSELSDLQFELLCAEVKSNEEYNLILEKINNLTSNNFISLVGNNIWEIRSFQSIIFCCDKDLSWKIIFSLEECGYNLFDDDYKFNLVEHCFIDTEQKLVLTFSSEKQFMEFLDKYPLKFQLSNEFQIAIENRKKDLNTLII